MEKLNTRLHDENNGLDYVLVGDYYFPALILAEDSRPVGRWGRMYKRYLKEHHSARYQALLLSGRLNSYLADIDAQAEEQLELLTQQMAEREGGERRIESHKSNGMGAEDEQHPESSGRSCSSRANL